MICRTQGRFIKCAYPNEEARDILKDGIDILDRIKTRGGSVYIVEELAPFIGTRRAYVLLQADFPGASDANRFRAGTDVAPARRSSGEGLG